MQTALKQNALLNPLNHFKASKSCPDNTFILICSNICMWEHLFSHIQTACRRLMGKSWKHLKCSIVSSHTPHPTKTKPAVSGLHSCSTQETLHGHIELHFQTLVGGGFSGIQTQYPLFICAEFEPRAPVGQKSKLTLSEMHRFPLMLLFSLSTRWPHAPHGQEVNLIGNQWVKIKPWNISDSFFTCVSSVSLPQYIHLQRSPVFSVSFKETLGPQACVPSEGWQSSTGNQANYWVEPMSCRGNYL